jgi:cell division protein FtsB
MLVGIGFVALLTATLAARFVKQDREKEQMVSKLDRLDERLDRLERELLGSEERID